MVQYGCIMKLLAMDSLGGLASATCFMHCCMVSVVPLLFTSIEFVPENNQIFEWTFFATTLLFALSSAILGYFKHNNPTLILGFSVGVSLLTLGKFFEVLSFGGSSLISIFGGLILFTSHLMSYSITTSEN